MITACKAYISVNGTQSVWTQPQAITIKKLQDSIRLNQEYQTCFHRTKERLAQIPDERPFDFSEMYIFGKFETFTRRCQNIIELFTTISTYNRLGEITIEGMEPLSAKFSQIVSTLKKKGYDFLDQRKQEFDADYTEFKNNTQELHETILAFINTQFEQITNTQRALAYIQRFERVNLPNVSLHDKYIKLLNAYARDIESVSRIYQKSRLEPMIARDLPPTTGKILWARQLYKRIQQPMDIFEKNRTILTYPEAKQIIKNYNRLCAVLLEYELLYHRAWVRQVDVVLSGLHASLIIKDLESSEYLINFDPEIMILIREAECMQRLKLEITPEAADFVVRQELFKRNFSKIKLMLDENKRIRGSIPSTFEQASLLLEFLSREGNQ